MHRKTLSLLLILVLLLIPCGAFAADTTTNSVKILMYHNLVTDSAQTSSVSITPEKFEQDVKYLADNGYNVVFPSELTAGGVPPKTVCITFDDGYLSNYELAFPILKKYGMKAEINIIVGNIGTNRNFLTWDMCREMEASGLIEIGSHTYNAHNPDCGGMMRTKENNGVQRLKKESGLRYTRRVLDDLIKSSKLIEQELGHKPSTFAYPFGASDEFSESTIRMLFRVTLLTANKTASIKNNLLDLYRYNVDMKTKLSKLL